MHFNGFADKTYTDAVSSLVNDYMEAFGIDVVYMRKTVAGTDNVLNEEIQIEYGHGAPMRIIFTDVPVEVDNPVIDKFGLDYQFGNYYSAHISKNTFNYMFASENTETVEPKAGDLVYVKGARIFLEVVDVSDAPNMFVDAGRMLTYAVKLHPWRNNMDVFTDEIVSAFDTWEGVNDLVFYRANNDTIRLRFPDQDGNTGCIDELNNPIPDDADQVTVTPDDFKTDSDDLGDALDKVIEDKDRYARNKTLKDEDEFGW